MLTQGTSMLGRRRLGVMILCLPAVAYRLSGLGVASITEQSDADMVQDAFDCSAMEAAPCLNMLIIG